MTDALERIWARKHPVKHGHHWHDATSSAEVATDINGSPGTINHFVPYRRADLPPTLAEAMMVPEVRALVEAVAWMQRAARNTFTLRTADYHDETCRCMRCAEDAVFAALAKLPRY